MTVGYDVVIVGGGHGGANTAIALRQRGFPGSIALLTDEPELPYERPPLSKDYLAGRKPFERMRIRPPEFWEDRGVVVRTNDRVVSVDAASRRLATESGDTLAYGDLVWAAGGVPRRLQCRGHDLGGVHVVRNRGDVDRLAGDLPTSDRIAIVGGGYIGLETAAVLVGLDKSVALVETRNRLLSRVAGGVVAGFLDTVHRSRGVDIRLSTAVHGIEGDGGRVRGLRLADGEHVPADLVIVGVGIEPAIEPLRAAGALCGNGVEVDAAGRTSLAHVYAVGDCALHAHPFAAAGQPLRLESVQNAVETAARVADALCGRDLPARGVPWFWSHQYDYRIQTAGICTGFDEEVVHGDPADHSFAVAYLRNGRVVAVDCVNAPKTFVEARSLFPAGDEPLKQRFGRRDRADREGGATPVAETTEARPTVA